MIVKIVLSMLQTFPVSDFDRKWLLLSSLAYKAYVHWGGLIPAHFYYSVKRSGITRWKQGYITPPPPYFILWNAVTSLGENKVI